MNNFKKEKIITHNLNIISTKDLLEEVKKFSFSGKGHYICITPVHAVIEAYNNEKFAEVVNDADLALPDGRPVFWALKLLNHKEAEHLPGYYVTKEICKLAAENNLRIGFYGGKNETLNKCISNLKKEFEKLTVSYAYSPPFRMLTNEEKKEIINNINNSEVEILFVCLGCPKQEYWMAENKDYLKCTSLGVGEVVNIISGTTKLTPMWIQKIGMRWMFRLMSDPRRLFWRYLSTNFKFIYLFSKQYFKFKFNL